MKRLIFTAIITALLAVPAWGGEKYGVYVKAIEKAELSFDDTVSALETGLKDAGFDVLASYEAGVEKECGLRAHNIVVNDDNYASEIMKNGPTAAFALPLRIGVYEDESGTHVAFVNPSSINRTVLGDTTAVEISAQMSSALSNAISASVMGNAVNAQIGEIRDEGYVGGMGGGKFHKKISTFHKGGELSTALDKVRQGIAAGQKGWKLVYEISPAEGVTIFGLTESGTEATAFQIAGDSRESKKLRCPGLDHAAAFPIEVVVYTEEGNAMVTSLDEMYRMKVYFEDAGNWAFMKNMSMPGRIEDQIEETVTSTFK